MWPSQHQFVVLNSGEGEKVFSVQSQFVEYKGNRKREKGISSGGTVHFVALDFNPG